MKKIAAFCIALMMIAALSLVFFDTVQGQGFNAFQQTTFTTVTVGQTLVENTVIGFNQLSWTVSGTVATCTVSLDSSPDGSTWTVGGIITGTTCTSNGNTAVTAGSANFMRVNMQAISGAGATVVVTYKGWVVNPSGGGGSGTVSPNNGVTAAIATYAAAGGSTTVGPAATSACIAGATSGSACLSSPAVAGTIGNAIVFTNAITVPATTTESNISFGTNNVGGATNTGLFINANNGSVCLESGGGVGVCATGAVGIGNGSGGVYRWVSGSDPSQGTAADTGISRAAADNITFGNGTAGDSSATIDFKTIVTNSNCSAVGTAANPSVASCGSAIAGSFSCATNASTGTCTINTTSVTANSEILITQRTDATTGTRLGVTCNTTVSTVIPVITAVTAATSFTINLGTITTNPECFSYWIVN